MGVLVAFLSASQDIVIDAYRVEILEERQQGAGAAAIVLGYRVAMLLAGAGALVLASVRRLVRPMLRWPAASWASLTVCWHASRQAAPAGRRPETGRQWLREAVVEPFADFLRRNGLPARRC